MTRRNTIQKELVLNAVRELKGHVSAQEVYEYISGKYTTISRGTVYRNLNILSDEGQIRKFKAADGADFFDFSVHEHYHVRCVSCGDISDVDMDVLKDLTTDIKNKHGYEFLGYDIFFEGLCPKCKEKRRN